MKLYEGTSGFSYPKWKGSFYPEKLAQKKFLGYYSEHLGAVEINNTFYRMPKVELLDGWRSQVGDDFRFVLKVPQRISHWQRLKPECEDNVDHLVKMARALRTHRGPFLLQLPPNFRCDHERLAGFFEIWPPQERIAVEFRHESWLNEETYEILRAAGAALCIAESGSEFDAPLEATASFGYLRLRREDYSDRQVAEWAARARAQSWSEVFVFFKHEDEGVGPRLAQTFRSAFEAESAS